MKITLRYEEDENREVHLTLRLTLPKKYQTGASKEVVKLFVDHYNKKFAETPLDASELHLKVAGGNHLEPDALMEDFVTTGDELYLLRGEVLAPVAPLPRQQATSAPAASSSSEAATKSTGSKVGADGKARCKRFGCNKHFDPEGSPQACTFHKSAPIFHETAKWWSCCPDRKAYDWDEFMRIPGCQTGFCSANPEGQEGKRFLGGTDLRADSAPVRIDADAPVDPRQKLETLRKGLVAVGVDGALFEKVSMKLISDAGGDMNKVVSTFAARFGSLFDNLQL